MDLITWLRAQLDEDERVARTASEPPWAPARVLAEVEAKRERLLWIEGELADDASNATVQWLAQLEAKPYAGRPGWRDVTDAAAGDA